jgi:histone deacetylase complex regulatory component SIN3
MQQSEWERHRISYVKAWRKVDNENYYRSRDHQFIIVKVKYIIYNLCIYFYE